MTGEGQCIARNEDPDPIVGGRSCGFKQKCCFAQACPTGKRRHPVFVQAVGSVNQARGIAQRQFGREHINRLKWKINATRLQAESPSPGPAKRVDVRLARTAAGAKSEPPAAGATRPILRRGGSSTPEHGRCIFPRRRG